MDNPLVQALLVLAIVLVVLLVAGGASSHGVSVFIERIISMMSAFAG